MSAEEDVMVALVASMAAAMPTRHVQRKLADPGNETQARLIAGVVCVVSGGGGEFANYQGREGELGSMNVKVVGFLQVPTKVADVPTTGEDVEKAELALLGDLLAWCQLIKPVPIDSSLPGDWRQSQQLEHPMGWLTLDLKVSHV